MDDVPNVTINGELVAYVCPKCHGLIAGTEFDKTIIETQSMCYNCMRIQTLHDRTKATTKKRET